MTRNFDMSINVNVPLATVTVTISELESGFSKEITANNIHEIGNIVSDEVVSWIRMMIEEDGYAV